MDLTKVISFLVYLQKHTSNEIIILLKSLDFVFVGEAVFQQKSFQNLRVYKQNFHSSFPLSVISSGYFNKNSLLHNMNAHIFSDKEK